MDYKKPSKNSANEAFMRQNSIIRNANVYKEIFQIRKSFLIICEGQNTEPLYFKGFHLPSNDILIEGACNSKTSLVDYALKVSTKEKYAGREVWCVFDYDVKPDEVATQPQDFNNAITKAESNGMKVAWSNDAFELWFVLHYQKLDAHVTREKLNEVLKKVWGLKDFNNNAKTIAFCKGHYERHGGNKSEIQNLAIKRAKKLHESYIGRQDFSNHCPCTTVYLLVEELNKNLKR